MKSRNSTDSATDASTLRRLLLAIVVFGLVGSGVELILLEHYEDSWQLVPLFFIGVTLVAIVVHLAVPSATTVFLLRALMGLLIVAGVVGVLLHYRGNLEFQLEMDPTQSGWQLFGKAMRAKAPPALAPGLMAQLGLLGLLYTYRHPVARRRELD